MRLEGKTCLLAFTIFSGAMHSAFGAETSPRTRDEKIRFPISESEQIEATLRIPLGCPQGTRFPAVLVFGGFADQAEILKFVLPDAPLILAAFAYPYMDGPLKNFNDAISSAQKLRKGVKATEAAISRLVPLIRDRSDVDPRHIAIVGASFGAPFAIHGAALTPGLSALVIVHGFGDVRKTIQFRLARLWKGRLGRLSTPVAWVASFVITAFLDSPSPEEDARLLSDSQSVLMIEAMDDQFIPPESREVLWRALAESPAKVKRIQMQSQHIRPGSKGLLEDITDLSLQWLHQLEWINPKSKCR